MTFHRDTDDDCRPHYSIQLLKLRLLPTYTNRNQIKLMIIMIIKLNGEAKILLLIIFYIIITRNPFNCNVLYP